MSRISVLKFGSTALRSATDLSLAVAEIYREWRLGRRVLAVVSTSGDTADELLKRAEQLGLPPDCQALSQALERSGIPSTLLDPTEFSPHELADARLNHALDNGVAVLPGHIDRQESRVLTETVAPPLRVALLGCGTVGGGVLAHLLARPALFAVTGVAVRDLDRKRDPDVPRHLLTRDPAALVEREADVVVELVGGLEPAWSLIARALDRGRHVVTANKALLADDVELLSEFARRRGVSLRYSASVGGALPALETVRRLADAGRVRRISGVLNGTCNFVLDRCAAGASFDQAVAEACAAGYAEAEPRLDLDGTDTAQKLSLLARAAFGQPIHWKRIARRGIDVLDRRIVAEAARRGRVTRLVACCERDGAGVLRASVQPMDLPPDHPFAKTMGAGNALGVELEGGDLVTLSAQGAGRWPTAESVLADLCDLLPESALPGTAGVPAGAFPANGEVFA